MNSYKVFMASILFFTLYTGASNFQQGFMDQQGVNQNQSYALDKEYQELRDTVDDIRENVRQVQSPETGILDSAVAGLYLVPDFLRMILAPITIMISAIDTIAASTWFLPQFIATGVKYALIIGVSWSAFRLLIGLRG